MQGICFNYLGYYAYAQYEWFLYTNRDNLRVLWGDRHLSSTPRFNPNNNRRHRNTVLPQLASPLCASPAIQIPKNLLCGFRLSIAHCPPLYCVFRCMVHKTTLVAHIRTFPVHGYGIAHIRYWTQYAQRSRSSKYAQSYRAGVACCMLVDVCHNAGLVVARQYYAQ